MSKEKIFLFSSIVLLIGLNIGVIYYVKQINDSEEETIRSEYSDVKRYEYSKNDSEATAKRVYDESEEYYENDYLKIKLESGWRTVDAVMKTTVGGVEKIVENPAAINIEKGKYILYINTNAQQASGVDGGRFAEIAVGSKSADIVMKVQPSEPCGSSKETKIASGRTRIDFSVSKEDSSDFCNVPSGNAPVWYFSYVTTGPDFNYFNYFSSLSPTAWVVTLSYDANTVNDLPSVENPAFRQAIAEMTKMVDSLVFKQ
jgi:hypothetical protein